MKPLLAFSAIAGAMLAFLTGCSTPQAKLSYAALPADGLDGPGFPFVVPRTVVKVTPTADKSGSTESVAFTSLPLAITQDKQAQLPTFVATDSSTNGWAMTPTTVSSVTYLDDLIVTAIGTQVTDNRKDVIDVVVTAASLAGAFASSGPLPDCAKAIVPLKPFVIDRLDGPKIRRVEHSNCWAYELEPAKPALNGRRPFPVADLGAVGTVGWFPIPACKSYTIRVFHCQNSSCTEQRRDVLSYSTTVSISDGTLYQRVPLPAKGKVSLHADFCGADVTNEGVGTSDWGLLKQLLTDIKTEKKK